MSAGEPRDWDPDVTLQAGLFLASRDSSGLLSTAHAFVELRSGAVRLGLLYDKTETRVGLGLALQW